jgi:hypothetical protein
MQPNAFEALLQRVATGQTTQADADLLRPILLAGGLTPPVTRQPSRQPPR